MNPKLSGFFLVALAPWIPFPHIAEATPAITCHCFTDRSFNTARPAAADPYFLATTQNSFFAAVFATDKKTVVMKKQRGVSSDDLWVAHWIASKSGMSAESLLQAKLGKETWGEVISPLGLPRKTLGPRFSAALDAKSSSTHLAESVVDDLVGQYRLLDTADLSELRKAGASNQELIISTLIAAKTRRPAKLVYRDVRNGSKTWGSSLSSAKIDAKDIPHEIAGMLRLPLH